MSKFVDVLSTHAQLKVYKFNIENYWHTSQISSGFQHAGQLTLMDEGEGELITVDFMLSPPPFLANFGVRVNIVFKGKCQISRS